MTTVGEQFIKNIGGTVGKTSILRRETFTATAGQRVFALTEGKYIMNTENLSVYVNGSYKNLGVDFEETTTSSFTMTSGLGSGDKVTAVYYDGNPSYISGEFAKSHVKGNDHDYRYYTKEQADFLFGIGVYKIMLDITTPGYASYQAMVDYIHSNGGGIITITSEIYLSNITFYNNIYLKFSPRGYIKPTGTVALGGCQLDAGLWKIFDYSAGGVVTGTCKNADVYPEWFGAKGDWDGLISGTDNANAFDYLIQWLAQQESKITLITGKYLIINKTIYYNSTDITNTLSFIGTGRGSAIGLMGYTDKWFLRVNIDPTSDPDTGTVLVAGIHSNRFRIKNITVNGSQSAGVWFCELGKASHTAEDTTLWACKRGYYVRGYTDNVTHRKCRWELSVSGGWYYYNKDVGDSLLIEQLWSQNDSAVYLEQCGSAEIVDCNGGYYDIRKCNSVTVSSGHFEFGEFAPAFKISNSKITFLNSHLRNDQDDYSPIHINDDLNETRSSRIVFMSTCYFHTSVNLYKHRRPDIVIENLKDTSEIITDCAVISYQTQFVSDVDPVSSVYSQSFGIKIYATDAITGLGARVESYRNIANNCHIRKIGGQWRISPPNIQDIPVWELPTPIFTCGSYGATDATVGTYYYKIESRNIGYKKSISSAEVSYNNADGKAIKLTLTNAVKGSTLFVFRGTSTGVYTKVAELVVTSDTPILVDTINNLSSFDWVDIGSNVPNTLQATGNGTFNILTGVLTMNKDSLPISDATYDKGCICRINSPGYGQPCEYVNTSNGLYWKVTKQAGIKKDTTANRPTLTAFDSGVKYLDTTLATNGKPIEWNGTAWVDATGTIV